MFTCRDMAEQVTAFLERTLGAGDRVRALVHLAMCGNCREYVRQMRTSRAALRRAGTSETAPNDLKAALRERMRTRRSG